MGKRATATKTQCNHCTPSIYQRLPPVGFVDSEESISRHVSGRVSTFANEHIGALQLAAPAVTREA
jgi:hypothetical protein